MILESLARRGDPDSVALMIEELRSPTGASPGRIAWFLGGFGTPGAIGALVEALADQGLRGPVSDALVRVGSPAVIPVARAAANPSLRAAAIEVLGRIRDPRASHVLAGALADDRPDVRVAALRALAQIGDPRTGPPVAHLLARETGETRRDALEALSAVGGPEHRDLAASFVEDSDPTVAAAALHAWCALDPSGAAERIAQVLASASDPRRFAAVDAALATRHRAFVPILSRLARGGPHAARATEGLAEVAGGAGIAALVRLAPQVLARDRRHVHVALAIALRKWNAESLLRDRARGLDLLRRGDDPWLRAVARDEAVTRRLLRELTSEVSANRQAAADGLGALATGEDELAEALRSEEDPNVFRSIARALLRLRRPVTLSGLWRWMETADTAPEALWLAAWSLREGSTPDAVTAARVRRSLRHALSDFAPRVRAGAARGIGIARDRGAWRSLVAALEDRTPEVRVAAARALAVLQVRDANELLRARWRIEPEERVAVALRDAVRSIHRRSFDPLEARGNEVLRIRVVPANDESGGDHVPWPIDAVLPDGTWIRSRTTAEGEWMLVDLSSAPVDVRVGLCRGRPPFVAPLSSSVRMRHDSW